MPNEQYLRYPSEQPFYKVIAPIMAILCLNTQYWGWYNLPKSKLFRIQRVMVPIFVPIATVSQCIYLALNYNEHEFSSIAVMLSIIPVASVVMCKSMIAQTTSYKRVFSDFMEKIHLYNIYAKNYPENKHNYIKQTLINAEKSIRYTLFVMLSCYVICYTAWMAVPIIHNIKNNKSINNITEKLELTVHLWQPFDYQYNFYVYLFLAILGMYCGAISITMIILFDTINLAFVYYLVGHIKLLKYDLKCHQNMELNDEEWKKFLDNVTITYYFITDTFKKVEAAFGLNVANIYAQNLFQGGLLLYQLMTSGKDLEVLLTYGLMIPLFMGMLLLISLVLENVRIQAEDIPSLVYDLPWESMSVSNQKFVQAIIFQVQPTLEFKAAFNIKTGIQPAINIIKTIFSIYVMIKNGSEM